MYPEITLIAYLIDRLFGEFTSRYHPVVLMGGVIGWFERAYYQDSILRGGLLTLTLLTLTALTTEILLTLASLLPPLLETVVVGILASMGLASKMLHDAVRELITHPHKIRYLVSRDTQELSPSDINKAGIETYAENLSDGVIAPLLYLLLFGLTGLFLYKAINTLDSMVGYKTPHYYRFGRIPAKLDDLANLLPSRLTALLIALLFGSAKALGFYPQGSQHESPNAGHPITAMALALGIRLGGDTVYFGKLKPKPHFGRGRTTLTPHDITQALQLQLRLDGMVILSLLLGLI